MNSHRKFSYVFWGALLLLFLVGVANHFGWLKRNPLNRIAIIKVNDHVLYAQEFSEKLAWGLKQYDVILAKDPKILEFEKDKILDEFINRSIVADWTKKHNIDIADKELDEALFEIRKNYPDDISFKQALSDSNQTLDNYKERLRYTLLQRKVFAYLSQKIGSPPDSELKDYYEKNKAAFVQKALVRLRQIVFEKEDAAQQLYHSLSSASSFADLAKKFSIAPEARNGGDTGWIERGTLEIFDRAFNMRVGQRTGVLKSPYGFHIFEVTEKKPESYLKFEQARDNILRTVRASKEQALYTEWLEDQIRLAQVFKNPEALKAIQVKALGE